MNSPARPPADDPLYALPAAARPHYATGMLLGARDFADEQTYHRNRLARALAFATGAGARRLPAGSLDGIISRAYKPPDKLLVEDAARLLRTVLPTRAR